MCINVDFPEPLLPIMATDSPFQLLNQHLLTHQILFRSFHNFFNIFASITAMLPSIFHSLSFTYLQSFYSFHTPFFSFYFDGSPFLCHGTSDVSLN